MSSQEVAIREAGGGEITTPTGQIIDLANATEVALAYDDLQHMKSMIREAEGILKRALIDHSAEIGKPTFEVGDRKVEVKRGTQTVFDALGLKQALEAAGCPDETVSEIVKETVEYKVVAVKAKQAAKTNAAYAAAVDANSGVEEKAPTVSVSRIGGGGAQQPVPASAPEGLTAQNAPSPADDPLSGALPWE